MYFTRHKSHFDSNKIRGRILLSRACISLDIDSPLDCFYKLIPIIFSPVGCGLPPAGSIVTPTP